MRADKVKLDALSHSHKKYFDKRREHHRQDLKEIVTLYMVMDYIVDSLAKRDLVKLMKREKHHEV